MNTQTVETVTPETVQEPKWLKIQSHKDYRYSPTMRAPKGSGLRIMPDGTVRYSTGFPAYAAPGSKPFKLTPLKPRADGAVKTFERLKDSIVKRAVRNGETNYTVKYAGWTAGDGFQLECTDGKAALLVPGAGNGQNLPLFPATPRLMGVIDNPEFHLALKRAAVVAESAHNTVRLVFTNLFVENAETRGIVTLDSADEHSAFDETVTFSGTFAEPFRVALNADFVEVACGAWPLSVYFIDSESPVVFEPADRSWRYVVMPIRDTFKKAVEL